MSTGLAESDRTTRGSVKYTFEESFVGFEGRFPLISVFDTDIVVSPSDIQFGEIFGTFEFVNEFGD